MLLSNYRLMTQSCHFLSFSSNKRPFLSEKTLTHSHYRWRREIQSRLVVDLQVVKFYQAKESSLRLVPFHNQIWHDFSQQRPQVLRQIYLCHLKVNECKHWIPKKTVRLVHAHVQTALYRPLRGCTGENS